MFNTYKIHALASAGMLQYQRAKAAIISFGYQAAIVATSCDLVKLTNFSIRPSFAEIGIGIIKRCVSKINKLPRVCMFVKLFE